MSVPDTLQRGQEKGEHAPWHQSWTNPSHVSCPAAPEPPDLPPSPSPSLSPRRSNVVETAEWSQRSARRRRRPSASLPPWVTSPARHSFHRYGVTAEHAPDENSNFITKRRSGGGAPLIPTVQGESRRKIWQVLVTTHTHKHTTEHTRVQSVRHSDGFSFFLSFFFFGLPSKHRSVRSASVRRATDHRIHRTAAMPSRGWGVTSSSSSLLSPAKP